MYNPDAELEYLLRSGFSRPQAEAILAVKRMAALRYPEQTIRLTLLQRGFSAAQAEVITRAALKANVAPRQQQPRSAGVSTTEYFVPDRTRSPGRRILAIFVWIAVLTLIRWLLFDRH